MKFLVNVDFSLNQLLNAILHKLGSAPSSPVAGQIYYNTATFAAYVWNGSAWRPLDAAALTDGSIANTALATNPLARANHTGTQLASTISNLATTVQAYSLSTFAAPTADISNGGFKLTSLAAAVAGTDATNLTQVNSLIAAAVSGQTAIKNPARVYAAGNLALTGLQTIDGVTVAAGDRVLAANQTTASQNNLYVVASGAWTVAADATPANQWLEGTEILIAEGTAYGGTIFRQVTANPTLTTLTFTQTAKTNTYTADETTLHMTGTVLSAKLGAGLTTSSGIAIDTAVVARKYSTTITGDGSTASFPVNHNLGTTDVIVQVYDSGGVLVFTDVTRTSTTVATIVFGTAPLNTITYRVTVIG